MKKKKISVRLITIAVIFAVVFTFMPVLSGTGEADAASRTKKMKVYTQCLKSGNYVYCVAEGGMSASIYRVNLKNSKRQRIVKKVYGEGGYTGNMSIKNGWLYYTITDDLSGGLYRIKASGKGRQGLANVAVYPRYAISGSKIYYNSFSYSNIRNGVMKKMNLNGKSKKSAKKYKVVMSKARTNAKGYKVIKKLRNKVYDYTTSDEDGYTEVLLYYNYYLQKPNGKLIFLETIKDYTWEYI